MTCHFQAQNGLFAHLALSCKSSYQSLTSSKVSEKTNEPVLRKFLKRMDRWKERQKDRPQFTGPFHGQLCNQEDCSRLNEFLSQHHHIVGNKGLRLVNHKSICGSYKLKICKTSIFHKLRFPKQKFKIITANGMSFYLSICLSVQI